ncbi:MAG: cobyric acid synthase [Acidimicrobiia bacterium]|nr:MAG: cobyric acid synthase [Acidimicrobiia bacterium]
MTALMVQGCTSSAGKSFIVAALARIYARRGLTVAPFKGQNMSNNARVVSGGEIGVAQWLQARAAGVSPDTRMNPLLIKPEDEGSQVIRNGVVDVEASNRDWRGRSAGLWPSVRDALHSLMDDFDLVVIEGAGSPAEFNLWDCDVANMRVADEADAPVLLASDIDRGGAFAHIYGTWAILPDRHKDRLAGFILNKFRGDAALLEPAPRELAEMTGVAHIGTLPWISHDLPDEDNASLVGRDPRHDRSTVAIVRWPTISNFDEFAQLGQVANIEWAEHPSQLTSADMIVLPGSKHVSSDLAWFRSSGFEAPLVQIAKSGTPIIGICGGMQVLGGRIMDPHGVDGSAQGLGLLPLTTVFESDKLVGSSPLRFSDVPGPWTALSGLQFDGYDIRHGRSFPSSTMPDGMTEILSDHAGFVSDNVLGIATHGLMESPTVLAALFDVGAEETLDAGIDRVADVVEEHLDITAIDQLVGIS